MHIYIYCRKDNKFDGIKEERLVWLLVSAR